MSKTFHLPVKSWLKSYEYKKPSYETIHMMRNIPVLKRCDNRWNINDRMRNLWAFRSNIKNYHAKFLPLYGVSLLVVWDFFQLTPVNPKFVFIKSSKKSCKSFNEWLWKKFQLHELGEIVWQNSYSDFAHLLNRFNKICKQIMMWFK